MAVIINLHEVNDRNWLDQVLGSLNQQFIMVSLEELLDIYYRKKSMKGICHITVDDGSNSFYENIYPTLIRHKIPSSLFVSPFVIVNRKNFWFQEVEDYDHKKLTRSISEVCNIKQEHLMHHSPMNTLKCFDIELIWEIIGHYKQKNNIQEKKCINMDLARLKEVFDSGFVTAGAHTQRHPVLANECDKVAAKEIRESVNNLSELLGFRIKHFAYPNGIPGLDFGQREVDILKDCGCLCAFSTIAGKFGRNTDIFRIPRFGLTDGERGVYTKIKLLFGSTWNNIMNLKPGNERNSRKILERHPDIAVHAKDN